MKFGSLFSGIGGMDLGLECAGMTCAWQVEIDDYCQRVLKKHWPNVPKYGDVKNVGRQNLEPVDLLVGGFPCQPHSVAGKRRGAEDDRNLWPEFSRVIREMRPRYVLAENVPGIITTYLDTVLSDLESQGYTCATFGIPAGAFGAPHLRQRIFVVAYTNRKRLEGCVRRPENSFLTLDDISSQHLWASWPNNIPQPVIVRGDDGFSSRVDRLRGLGNAVVPQVAKWIGRRIIEFDQESGE